MLELDDYTLARFLGKGTFGEVYLTKKRNSNNVYATKRMDKQMVDDPRYKKYFNNEIKILKQLFHENIIRLEDLKVTKNHYYIIMEYCNGGSLKQCLDRYKEMYHHAFTEEIVQYIMRQVMSAVKYMHSQRIIHRDLKLDNILVHFLNINDYNSVNLMKAKIKIIDFGFASSKEDSDMFSTAIGSPLNMDPLILKKFNAGRAQTNDLKYDEKADIWSIGALCYQMLIGNSPFDAYNMQELVEKIEEGTYKVPTNLSKEVVSFLNGMLQYDPNKRLTAENLSNHAFLTKNVSEFTHINTNMIGRKVYGGQLNINIKNNQSIWAIFNEENQKTFDNIPGNFYSSDAPLSESVYIETNDSTPGITPRPYDQEQDYINTHFSKTDSVPIPGVSRAQTSSSTPPFTNEGLNIPQPPLKNTSDGFFQYSQTQQNQYNNQAIPQMINNPNNQNNPNNSLQQKPDFVTIKNGYFLSQPKPAPQVPQTPQQITTQMQQVQRPQQMQQQNYQMRNPFPNNNIVVNIGPNKPPVIQQQTTPNKINNREMATNPNQNAYNQINNRTPPYVPGQVPNVNQIQNQQNLYQRNLQGQLVQPNNKVLYQPQPMALRPVAQNPIVNQVPQRRINNINNPPTNQPHLVYRQAPINNINNIPKQINPPPNQLTPQRNMYQARTAQNINPVFNQQIQPQNRMNNITPQKRIVNNMNFANSNIQNEKRIIRPEMKLPQKQLARVPSDPQIIRNNYNLAHPGYQQNIQQVQNQNTGKKVINNGVVAPPIQNGVARRIVFTRNPNVNQQGGNFNVVPRNNF